MLTTTFSANPLAPPRPTQTTTHTVTETTVTGPPQQQTQVLYQQYAQPSTQYIQQSTAPQPSQGATQYLQQSSAGATQYLQQGSVGVSQYLQQPSQGATQYLQPPKPGVFGNLQQSSPGVSQYAQQVVQDTTSTQYVQAPQQSVGQHAQHGGLEGGQYGQVTTEYAQAPTRYAQSSEVKYTQPAGTVLSQSTTQYKTTTNQGSPGFQYHGLGGVSQSLGQSHVQSHLPTPVQTEASYMQSAPEVRGFHSFARNQKPLGGSAFVSGPVPDSTPMVTSGSTGTIIPRQQPYAFTTVTYAKTKPATKDEVDPNFKNSYLNAQGESHSIRERPIHPVPAKSSPGCC